MRSTLKIMLGLCAAAGLLGACSKRVEGGATAGLAGPSSSAVAAGTALMDGNQAHVAGVGPAAAAAFAEAAHPAGIAWHAAASDADVDAAFRQAKAKAKPVFLYWGASWCPPCNQVKVTLFNRQDFIERSRAFVAVYVDGDTPGAQKLGARFHVSGYPTMLLFSADGTEVTRLPGEVEPARYAEVLTLGMNARRPVKAVLADALAGGKDLSANDWRLLAFYSWDTDEQQLVPRGEVPALLQRLAAACPPAPAETATRLWLKAIAARDDKAAVRDDPAAVDRLVRLLGDDAAARAHFDALASSPAEITRSLSRKGSPARSRLVAAFERVLQRFEADPTLSRADRISALIGRVDLAKIDSSKVERPKPGATAMPPVKLAPALLADVRDQAARADREITDGYERQAVITAAAYLLSQAGLLDESDALLKTSLSKSHSPYYLMTELAGNAAQRGDAAAALGWYRQAFEASEGPATRLQWGARYVAALIELTPGDEAGIEHAALQLLDEAAAQPHVFYERSARSLGRVGAQLRAWNGGGKHTAAVRRFEAQLGAMCSRLDPADAQRATCNGLLKAEPRKAV